MSSPTGPLGLQLAELECILKELISSHRKRCPSWKLKEFAQTDRAGSPGPRAGGHGLLERFPAGLNRSVFPTH